MAALEATPKNTLMLLTVSAFGRSVSHQRNIAYITVDHFQDRVYLLRLQFSNSEEGLLVDAVSSVV